MKSWRGIEEAATAAVLVLVFLGLTGCGSTAKPQTSGPLSGNWQITLTPQINPPSPLPMYSGFLLQTGNSVAGSLVLGDGCAGVGPVSGSVSGNNFQLDVNEFGQDLSLTGAVPSPNSHSFMGGQFSTLSGGCTTATTGTWSAYQIPSLTGPFHGTLTSSSNGTVDLAGTFTQGPNTGASNATLNATVAATSVPPFCSYLTTGTITGVISGTSVSLFFYDANGTLLNVSGLPLSGTVERDGTSLTVLNYGFSGISKSCTGDNGELQLSFP